MIRKAAHAFVSSAGGIGARALADILKRIESAAGAARMDEAAGLVPQAVREFELVDAYLRRVTVAKSGLTVTGGSQVKG